MTSRAAAATASPERRNTIAAVSLSNKVGEYILVIKDVCTKKKHPI